jgi:hypothetical protein
MPSVDLNGAGPVTWEFSSTSQCLPGLHSLGLWEATENSPKSRQNNLAALWSRVVRNRGAEGLDEAPVL